jgi:hypothetical protein
MYALKHQNVLKIKKILNLSRLKKRKNLIPVKLFIKLMFWIKKTKIS